MLALLGDIADRTSVENSYLGVQELAKPASSC